MNVSEYIYWKNWEVLWKIALLLHDYLKVHMYWFFVLLLNFLYVRVRIFFMKFIVSVLRDTNLFNTKLRKRTFI